MINKDKSQTMKIIDAFVTTAVVLSSATLIASGLAISKVNTQYMATGVKAAKIVAERENKEISITLGDRLVVTPEKTFEVVDNVMSLLPAPINTGYIMIKEIRNAVFEE